MIVGLVQLSDSFERHEIVLDDHKSAYTAALAYQSANALDSVQKIFLSHCFVFLILCEVVSFVCFQQSCTFVFL